MTAARRRRASRIRPTVLAADVGKVRGLAIAMSRRIQMWPLEQLKPYDRNPRTHSSEQVAQLAAIITEFGFTDPLLVDGKRGLIAGHLRLAAARSLGLPRVPVIELTHLSKTQKRAFVMAHNRIALSGGWDEVLAREELVALQGDGFDLELTAFTDQEIAAFLASGDEPAAEEDGADLVTVDVPANPVTRPGDTWRLGEHRLLAGDSTKLDQVRALVAGAVGKVDMVFTDPPYAIYGSSTGIAADITDDKMVRPFFRDVLVGCVAICKPFAHVYVCCDWRSWASWWEVAKGTGIVPKNMIVWDKGGGLGASYQNTHELLFFGSVIPRTSSPSHGVTGIRQVNDSNIWKAARVPAAGKPGGREHNAQKPVQLIERAIRNSTDEKALVVDLFAGAGSILIACERAGRICRTMEIEPRFCDVAVRRWQEFTGQSATLEGDGRTFGTVASGRPRRIFEARRRANRGRRGAKGTRSNPQKGASAGNGTAIDTLTGAPTPAK